MSSSAHVQTRTRTLARRLWRRALRIGIAGAVLVAGVVAVQQSYADSTSPTTTSTSPHYTTDLLTTKIQAYRTGGLTPVLRLPDRTMRAGERILVTARLAARSNAARMPRMAIRVDAVGAGQVLRSPVKSINHDGADHGIQYISVRWLLTAPATGTYTITARAEATTYLEPVAETHLTAVQDLTYLKLSDVGQTSVTWGDDHSGCVGARSHPDPDVPECGTARSRDTALARTVNTGGATTATVLGDVELSREYGSYPGGTSAVEVTLYATPVGEDGAPCAGRVSRTYPVTITSTKHHWHQMTTLRLDVSCAAKLDAKVVVRYVSGNPVGIEDKRESNAIALLS